MSLWLWCYKCETATPESSMLAYSVWNIDAQRTQFFVACPCGERDDFTDAFQCDKCEEYCPESGIEIGTDLCINCAAAEFGTH